MRAAASSVLPSRGSATAWWTMCPRKCGPASFQLRRVASPAASRGPCAWRPAGARGAGVMLRGFARAPWRSPRSDRSLPAKGETLPPCAVPTQAVGLQLCGGLQYSRGSASHLPHTRSIHDDQGRRQASRRHAVRIHRGRRQRLLVGPNTFKVEDQIKGKKIVIFGLPGAFTPTCSAKHVPSYLAEPRHAEGEGRGRGVCLSVNDAVRDGRMGARPEGGRQDPHHGRRQRGVHQGRSASSSTSTHAAWACAASASRCWSTTAW